MAIAYGKKKLRGGYGAKCNELRFWKIFWIYWALVAISQLRTKSIVVSLRSRTDLWICACYLAMSGRNLVQFLDREVVHGSWWERCACSSGVGAFCCCLSNLAKKSMKKPSFGTEKYVMILKWCNQWYQLPSCLNLKNIRSEDPAICSFHFFHSSSATQGIRMWVSLLLSGWIKCLILRSGCLNSFLSIQPSTY